MSRFDDMLRPVLLLIVAPLSGLALGAWALVEARQQRTETSATLTTQAQVLARTLGPPLAAASAATREINDLLARRLLDDAHLIGRLHALDALTPDGMHEIAAQHELDSAVVTDADGRVIIGAGQTIPPEVLATITDGLKDGTDAVILGTAAESHAEHLTVASTTADGGAVVLRIHATAGCTFTGHLGVESLLLNLVSSEGVAYLSLQEGTEGAVFAATWDGGPVPEPSEGRTDSREIRGRTVFEVEVPVKSPMGIDGSLRVGLDGEPLARGALLAARRTTLVGTVVVLFSLSMAGIAFVIRRRTREREEAARQITKAETARRRNERLAAAGALAAGVAHEVRGPLNAIVLAAQRIERRVSADSECGRFAGTIRNETGRLDAVLRQFLELARPVEGERQPAEVCEIAEEVRRLLREEAEAAHVTIHPVTGHGSALIDSNSIRRALINLVKNAIHASPRGGEIELTLSRQNGAVVVRVLDRGTGIGGMPTDSLFDPFVSGRTEGTGLGLALVRRVADEHGGRCSLADREGGGAEATLWLPAEG